MREREDFPLQIDEILYAAFQEWRLNDVLPPRTGENWQLVYVRSGIVEERCDRQKTILRAGGILLHQPQETHAMWAVGQIPPEVLRLEFICPEPVMDVFRGRVFHADAAEQVILSVLCRTVPQVFQEPESPGDFPAMRLDRPFGAAQQMTNYLENLLIMLARRVQRARKPSQRARREHQMAALVDETRLYFAGHLAEPLRLEEVCAAMGIGRQQLQEAFRARLRHGPMEELAAMRLEYAAQLLARGATPGEVADRLGYCSGAYFTRCFKQATGHTPSEYRRIQQGLAPKRQQKDKIPLQTSIPIKDEPK